MRLGEIAKNYAAKFPNTPTLTLAKKIYKENMAIFTDVEHIRTTLRTIRGQAGEHNRKHIKDKALYKEVGDLNPFKLPESYAVERKPFKLPLADNNILVLSDLHIPYHSIDAITCALNYGVENNVNTIFINGDLLDFYQLSRFEKQPYKRSVAQEFEAARALLQVIRDTFPTQNIYWLKGNHDLRYEKYLYVKSPEIFDVEDFQLDVLLRLNELKIKLIDDNVLVKMGRLNVSHGHLIIKGIFAPVNSARGAFMKAKSSILIGHTHTVSNHTEGTIEDDIISCWSTGCLCQLRPDYDSMNTRHKHGFAHVEVQKNGNFHVNNFMIKNGKIL